MTDRIRSLAFNFLFFSGSLFFSITLLWTLLLPRERSVGIVRGIYFGYMNFIEKYIMGLRLHIEGWEHVPKEGAFILASKHQSAYETLKLCEILDDPAIVLKRELTWIPIWGWYPKKMGMIPIDRGSVAQAMRSIIKGAERVKSEGRPILIFPQGTRVAPGVKAEYRGGIGKIYKDVGLPVIPMALNSGLFWGRNAFWKKSGTVSFRFLPAIPAGLPPQEMMQQLEDVIEKESDALLNPDIQ
ncbi:MAG: 1-acyl-sn-glycerol-3-phosphate acyltransferase [Alphaproteobacteria bacterium]|nr:MAG: 1-acyl-sn-glycerol-3-phosphate acyltransferase [Alphaproteobacteria bacterium]